jgi:hypothetical protein
MRTLVSTLVSHGGKLAPPTWKNCLWDILFPLLERVRQQAAAASAAGGVLRTSATLNLLLLLHASV